MSTGRPPLPGPHLGLQWSPLTVADDEGVRLLLTRARAVDQSTHPDGTDLSPHRLHKAGVDLAADSLAGLDDQGVLRAAAVVHRKAGHALLSAVIDPGWRGRGIGRAMLRWQDACAQRIEPVSTHVMVDESRTDQRRLCAAAGFTSAGRVRTVQRPFDTSAAPSFRDGPPGASEPVIEDLVTSSGRAWTAHVDGRACAVLEGEEIPVGWPDHGAVRLRWALMDSAGSSDTVALPLLVTALRAYASADMVTARIDVDLRQDGVLHAAHALGFETLSEAVRYSTEPAVRP
ncbi:GNAT family N-acetyltransferase [Ruania alba]|uniref:Acetyltransferase (GNAT) family protein n=1 Tax=Ruania alba TaxID=648782 RepID=A0A1H5FIP8_9MICO|nr:GNAT family N-acetyltransferase [Ruania alba]SEE03283.1 Acetyltransferase (GNAT) family protein [Ruania alba]